MHVATRMPRFLHLAALFIAHFIQIYASDGASPSKETCLLQQKSSSQRSSRGLKEDAAFNRVAPTVSPRTSSVSGSSDNSRTRPKSVAKTSPKSGAKTSSRRWMKSTAIEDILDDESVSQRAELHLPLALGSVEESYGSVSEFVDAMKEQLMKTMGDVDPKRFVMLGLRGEYLDDDPSTAALNQFGEHRQEGSQVDFELVQGAKGKASPGRLMKGVLEDLRDKRGHLLHGAMKKVFQGAAMLVVSGSRSTHPAIEYGHQHKVKVHKKGEKPREDETKIHKSGSTEWYPWEWFGEILGGARGERASWTVVVLLVLQVVAEWSL